MGRVTDWIFYMSKSICCVQQLSKVIILGSAGGQYYRLDSKAIQGHPGDVWPEAILNCWARLLVWLPIKHVCRMGLTDAQIHWPGFLVRWVGSYTQKLGRAVNLLLFLDGAMEQAP